MILFGPDAAPLLAELHARCVPPADRWDASAMEALLRMPGCFAALATTGKEPAAPTGLALARVAADEAELLTIGVLPSARRNGDGIRLLRHVVSEAAARGAGRLFLEVSVVNHAALALYRRCGCNEVGRRRSYYPDGSDALILSRSLSAA